MWTCSWGVVTTTLHCFTVWKQKALKTKKNFHFYYFSAYFLLTLYNFQFWQPRQLFQSCGSTLEVLGLLPCTTFHCLISKRPQNQEKRALLLVFRSLFLLTLNKLKLWLPRQLYQPCGLKHEVLELKKLIGFSLQSYKFHIMWIGNHTNRHIIGFAWLPILLYVDIFYTRHCTTIITPKTHFSLVSYKIEFVLIFVWNLYVYQFT